MRPLVKAAFDGVVDSCLSRTLQIRLGEHVLNRAKGQGDGDPQTNGEYWLASIIKAHLRTRRSIVFDVGANRGEWTAHFAEGMSDKLTIVLFEPVPKTFEQLEINLAHMTSPVATKAVNAALSDVVGTAAMYIDVRNPTAGSNSRAARKAHVYGLFQREIGGIALVTGEDFCEKNGIGHIDFMKIDTQGHECAVLKGCSKMLAQRKIDFIQFEYGGTWIDSKTDLSDAFELLNPYGYVVCRVHPKCLEVFESYDQRQETFAHANYAAVRRELLPLFAKLQW